MRLIRTSKKKHWVRSWYMTLLCIPLLVLFHDLVPLEIRSRERPRAAYVIDVLSVGRKEDASVLQTQRQTWASHEAVRRFDIAIHGEYDDPKCDRNMTSDEVEQHLFTCRNERYWNRIGASIDHFTKMVMQVAYEPNYVMSKPNPAGWTCAQRHIAKSFIAQVSKYNSFEAFPDYLIVVDSDTYLDIDELTKFLFGNPYRVPSYDEPVIWAGCKMNFGNPKHNAAFTTPYGGFGTVFSQRSLRLMNAPLYCANTLVPSALERTICNKFTHRANFSYPVSTTIGEQRFFSPGDSITDVFRKYLHEIKPFCLHSDHLYAYLATFLRLSRIPVEGDAGHSRWGMLQEFNRLHSIKGNEVHVGAGETCPNDGSCNSNAIVCHRMSSDDMMRVHRSRLNPISTPKKLPVTSVTEQMLLPNILLAGVQKSASTSIANYLFDAGVCRPRVFDSEPAYYRKEVHFFNNPGRYEQGLQFYRRRFDDCSHEKFVMDATPETFLYPERVHSTYSSARVGQTDFVANLKIIVTLREPVARELSWYNHQIKQKKIQNISFEEYATDLSRSLSSTKNDGYYAHFLAKWFRLFPRKNILVLSYDEVKANPTKVLWRIRTFLGLSAASTDPNPLRQLNTQNSSAKVLLPSCDVQKTLADVFESENQKLYDLMDSTPGNFFEQQPFPKFTLSDCIPE